jgi:hypothetical protein
MAPHLPTSIASLAVPRLKSARSTGVFDAMAPIAALNIAERAPVPAALIHAASGFGGSSSFWLSSLTAESLKIMYH